MDENSNEITTFAKKIDRNELLKRSAWLVDSLHGRLSKPKFMVYDNDPVKLQYYRVYIQAVQVHNAILKDDELEDIKTRLEALEATK